MSIVIGISSNNTRLLGEETRVYTKAYQQVDTHIERRLQLIIRNDSDMALLVPIGISNFS